MNFDSNLECVLFDLDGTLVDTAPAFVYALNNLLQEQKRTPINAKAISSKVSDGARELIKFGFEIDDKHKHFKDLIKKFLNIYEKKLETT